MSKRSQRYKLDLGRDWDFELTAAEWNELLSGGWIEEKGFKRARLKRGVVAWVKGGNLHLLALARIGTVTAGWWRAWLFKVDVVKAAELGMSQTERHMALLYEQERERQNEALLWRTFRNTKGANEFTWIAPEVKAELIAALKPAA